MIVSGILIIPFSVYKKELGAAIIKAHERHSVSIFSNNLLIIIDTILLLFPHYIPTNRLFCSIHMYHKCCPFCPGLNRMVFTVTRQRAYSTLFIGGVVDATERFKPAAVGHLTL